ncbi:MAG: hypothetical protein M0Z58_03160 [Nitrospiraceae bacterium]|nr:hypothetical protein [Nitrospiraceae bacterium]
MTLPLSLLVLESVLLVFTILLLLDSIKEGRSRSRLLVEIQRAAKTFTRLEYFLAVVDSMADAGREVAGLISGRFPSGTDRKRTKDIVNSIEKAGKAGVNVKYILPRFHDRLYIGCLYSNVGAEVRYSSCPTLHDLRYTLVDDGVTIIGVPEGTGEKEATKKGYKIISEGLNSVLREHFNNCWGHATPYAEYLREVIRETKATPRQLALELKIDEKDLEKFYKDI